jgi:hypothetical protein
MNMNSLYIRVITVSVIRIKVSCNGFSRQSNSALWIRSFSHSVCASPNDFGWIIYPTYNINSCVFNHILVYEVEVRIIHIHTWWDLLLTTPWPSSDFMITTHLLHIHMLGFGQSRYLFILF